MDACVLCVIKCITSNALPTQIPDLVFVSPGASWVTDVCYPKPSESAQCAMGGRLPVWASGCEMRTQQYCGCTWLLSFTWHSFAEGQTSQRHHLSVEISASSGALALIGFQASSTPKEEIRCQVEHAAGASICMIVVCLLDLICTLLTTPGGYVIGSVGVRVCLLAWIR